MDWEADWVALWLPVSGGGVGAWIVAFRFIPDIFQTPIEKLFVFRFGFFVFGLNMFLQFFV